MSAPNQKYQRRTAEIVEASATSQSQQQQYYIQNTAADKKVEAKLNQTTSFLGQSEEFKIFWGEHLETHWFEKKTFVSPFIIILALTSFFTIYLSVRLLFSPGEFEQLFTADPETIATGLATQNARQDEKDLLSNSSSATFEKKDDTQKNVEKTYADAANRIR